MRDTDDIDANPSANPRFEDVLARAVSRRRVLQGGLLAAGAALLGPAADRLAGRQARAATGLFSFTGVPLSRADKVIVPEGYTAEVVYAWGDPISDGPAFKADAT